MIQTISLQELVNDVNAYLKSKKSWESAMKYPNFISNKKKKYKDYLEKMKILENKYRKINIPSDPRLNYNIIPSTPVSNYNIMPSAPVSNYNIMPSAPVYNYDNSISNYNN